MILLFSILTFFTFFNIMLHMIRLKALDDELMEAQESHMRRLDELQDTSRKLKEDVTQLGRRLSSVEIEIMHLTPCPDYGREDP